MKQLLTLLVSLLVTACSPRLTAPHVATPDRYIYATEQVSDSLHIGQEWWKQLGDTTLNRLIERALSNNRNIAIAASRVEEARLNLKVVRTQYLPQIGLGISVEGSYSAATRIVQTYALEPSLSWEVSLFGALRNAKRAAKAQIAATEWAYHGVRLSLAAEVATAYFTLLEYQRDLEIAQRSFVLRCESAALIDSMVRYGMSDGVALAQAQSMVYTAQADIPLYTRAVEQTMLSINTLLGDMPQPAQAISTSWQQLTNHYPAPIPVGLPSELLTRRPDVQQSHYQVMQAAANAGLARSARFPTLALTGKGGVASGAVKSLFSGNPWAWNVAGSLMEPLFAFGKLRSGERIAVEGYNQAALNYEQTALAAFAEVESALVAITTYQQQALQSERLVAANAKVDTMTQALYRSGLSDYLAVIDAQRNFYQSQMQDVNIASQQYINYVNLCKALGGGW